MGHRRDQRPVTDDDREQVRALHAQGLGRNEIARQINRAQRTVSVLAAEMGLVFDVTMTEDATRHRVAQLAAVRAELALDLAHDAVRLTGSMWEPAKVFNFGGKDNTYEDREVDEPPADAKKNLMAAAGMAIDRSLRLVPPAAEESGLEAARSMLTGLAEGIRRIAEAPEDTTGEG